MVFLRLEGRVDVSKFLSFDFGIHSIETWCIPRIPKFMVWWRWNPTRNSARNYLFYLMSRLSCLLLRDRNFYSKFVCRLVNIVCVRRRNLLPWVPVGRCWISRFIGLADYMFTILGYGNMCASSRLVTCKQVLQQDQRLFTLSSHV